MILIDSEGHSLILQRIVQGDYWLFSKINQQWANPVFDHVLPFLRQAEIWVPFYLFLLLFITLNFGRKGWWWALFLIVTAIIGDLVSSHLIKESIDRLRPCREPAIADTIRILVNYCPESSSFTSSHACNHFALANFIFLTLRSTSKWWGLVYVWAFLISYTQIYVGVHFPVDVICGAILGLLIGYGTSRLFRLSFGPIALHPYNHTHA